MRGSLEPGDTVTEEEKAAHADFQRIERLKQFVNGDWRSPNLQHCERGCCASREAMVQNVTAAIAEGLLFPTTDLPAKNRWGSCSKHLARQAACHACHNILSRVLQRAFPN